jgi:ferredoxin-NADP reductase
MTMEAMTVMTTTAGQLQELRVTEVRWEADGVLSLRFDALDGGTLPAWTPGAHLDVRFGNGVERQYSLCGRPGELGWRVAVLREEVSRGGSRFVHETLRVGDTVEVRGPINTFELEPGTETILVAGGIGITPLLPMMAELEARSLPWRLVYLGRRRSGMAYLRHPLVAGARSRVVASQEDGRVELAEAIGAIPAGAKVYACGPERMLAGLEELAAGWQKGVLRLERFHAKPMAESLSSEAFDVECRRSGITVTVEKDCSILSMLEAAGIPVPSSCLEGVCGTCETTLVDGEAEHRDSILSPDEREANETMMICVSRATTPRLVLDI